MLGKLLTKLITKITFDWRKPVLFIKIIRKYDSLEYKRQFSKPFDWYNNDGNNSLDDLIVYDGTSEVMRCKVQTVSNMEGLDVPTSEFPRTKFTDTIATGTFQIKLGLDKLDPRNFYGRICGISNTKTLGGDAIGTSHTTARNSSRWLVHDWQKHKPNPAGVDTRVAWSAGCFILRDLDLIKLNALFDTYQLKVGDLVDGELVMGD